MRGGVDQEDVFFVPGLLGFHMYRDIPESMMGAYPPRVRRDLDIDPRGNARSALGLCAPANRRSVYGDGESTP